MPHPSTNHLISRVRDFIRWQEKMFGDPSARGAPLEDPPGWATDKEFWIRNTVWRETIFEGNNDDSTAAADALIDHGLLRAKQWESSSEVRERTVSVRVRDKIFRAFVVNKSILAWRTFLRLTAGFVEPSTQEKYAQSNRSGNAVVCKSSSTAPKPPWTNSSMVKLPSRHSIPHIVHSGGLIELPLSTLCGSCANVGFLERQ
jgi:hypothetical protein